MRVVFVLEEVAEAMIFLKYYAAGQIAANSPIAVPIILNFVLRGGLGAR